MPGIGVGRAEVELAADQEVHGTDGVNASEAPSVPLGGMKRAVERFEEALVRWVWAQATRPSMWQRTSAATSLIGSTLERMAQLHQCLSMSHTTLIYSRSRISRNGCLWAQARAVRDVAWPS